MKADVAHVLRRWDRDDRRHASQARHRVRKRLERCATKLEERGEYAQAALVHYRIGRLRGMGSTLDVAVNVRGRVEHAHLPADPKAWLAAFSAGLAELGLLMPRGRGAGRRRPRRDHRPRQQRPRAQRSAA